MDLRLDSKVRALAAVLALVGPWALAGADSEKADAKSDEPAVAETATDQARAEARRKLEAAVHAVAEAARELAATDPEAAGREAEVTVRWLERRIGEMERRNRAMAARRPEMVVRAELAKEGPRAWNPRFHTRDQQKRAHLGVMIQDAEDDDGALVVSVLPHGGAAEAGINGEDLIVEVNGEPLTDAPSPSKALQTALRKVSPGDTVRLVVRRDGESLPVEVVTTPGVEHAVVDDVLVFSATPWRPDRWRPDRWRPDRWRMAEPAQRPPLALVDIGQDLGDYFGVDAGVLVVDTPAGSELKPGDILQRIGGADVASSRDARRLLASAGATVEAQVLRKKRKTTVTVRAEEAGAPWAMQFRRFSRDGGRADTPAAKVVPAPRADVEGEANGD